MLAITSSSFIALEMKRQVRCIALWVTEFNALCSVILLVWANVVTWYSMHSDNLRTVHRIQTVYC